MGGWRLEVGGGRWEVGGGRCEVGDGRWEVGGGGWEVGGWSYNVKIMCGLVHRETVLEVSPLYKLEVGGIWVGSGNQ